MVCLASTQINLPVYTLTLITCYHRTQHPTESDSDHCPSQLHTKSLHENHHRYVSVAQSAADQMGDQTLTASPTNRCKITCFPTLALRLGLLGLGPALVPLRGVTGPEPYSLKLSATENSPKTSCPWGPWQWPLTMALRTCNLTLALRLGLGLALMPLRGATGPVTPAVARHLSASVFFSSKRGLVSDCTKQVPSVAGFAQY